MENVVITGGKGFVGSHLCCALAKKNNVLVIDNLFNPTDYQIENTHNFVKGDSAEIQSICEQENFVPDKIFHLGEYSRVETSFEDVDLVLELNRQSFGRVLTFAKKINAKLIYSASSTLFSEKDKNYVSSPYEKIKKENVSTLLWYAQLTNLQYAITYFYNVYGIGEKADGRYATVVAKFLNQWRRGCSLSVRLPGTQTRNFTHISDLISGLLLVSEKGSGDGYSIGHPQTISILQLAKMISKDIKYLPETKGNRKSSEIDTTKLRDLGWEAKIRIEEYISEQMSKKPVA